MLDRYNILIYLGDVLTLPTFSTGCYYPDVINSKGDILIMSKQTHNGSRQEEKLKIIYSIKGPVAYMMPEDIGKLVVHSSKISGYLPITSSYATEEISVGNLKVLMAIDNLISFESLS